MNELVATAELSLDISVEVELCGPCGDTPVTPVPFKLYTVSMPDINGAFQIYTPKGDFTWVFGAGQFAAFVQAEYADGGEPTGFAPISNAQAIGWFYTDEDPGIWYYVNLGDPQAPQPLAINESETNPTVKCWEASYNLTGGYDPSTLTIGYIGAPFGVPLTFWTEFPWLAFDDPSFVSTMQYYLSSYLGKNVVVECDIAGNDITFRVKNTYLEIGGNGLSQISDGTFVLAPAPFYSISCS